MISCRLKSLPLLLQICCGIYLITWLIFMLFVQTVQKDKGEELHPHAQQSLQFSRSCVCCTVVGWLCTPSCDCLCQGRSCNADSVGHAQERDQFASPMAAELSQGIPMLS